MVSLFLVPPSQNEPWLSSALRLLKEILDDLHNKGISSENIYFMGFSQGACLTLEFVTRNTNKYGGVVAFTGGLIGDKIYQANYKGDFQNTPVLIGSSNTDPHAPVERVYATTNILKKRYSRLIFGITLLLRKHLHNVKIYLHTALKVQEQRIILTFVVKFYKEQNL